MLALRGTALCAPKIHSSMRAVQGSFTHTGMLLHPLVSPSCSRCNTQGASSTRGSPHGFSMCHRHSHSWGLWPWVPTLRPQKRCSNTC